MAGMNMDQLRYFVAVAHSQNVSQTAAELYMTQPSLSRSLARLEAELGCKLFEHQRGRIVLNDAGKRFLPHAEAALREVRQGLDAIASPVWDKGLTLGSLVEGVLATVLPGFAAAHPQLKIRQVPVDPARVESILCSGDVDLVICAAPRDTQALTYYPLGQVEQALFCAKTSRWAKIEQLGLDDLAQADFACDATRMPRSALVSCCEAADFTPHIVCEVEDTSVIRAVLLSGEAVCVMPRPQYRRLQDMGIAEGITCKSFAAGRPQPPLAAMSAVYAAARPLGRTAREFCDYMAAQLAEK